MVVVATPHADGGGRDTGVAVDVTLEPRAHTVVHGRVGVGPRKETISGHKDLVNNWRLTVVRSITGLVNRTH